MSLHNVQREKFHACRGQWRCWPFWVLVVEGKPTFLGQLSSHIDLYPTPSDEIVLNSRSTHFHLMSNSLSSNVKLTFIWCHRFQVNTHLQGFVAHQVKVWARLGAMRLLNLKFGLLVFQVKKRGNNIVWNIFCNSSLFKLQSTRGTFKEGSSLSRDGLSSEQIFCSSS